MSALERALDELEITGPVRAEMMADPERGLATIAAARRARGIRNVAAFVITRWRAGRDRPGAVEPELVAGPPDLDALEYVWSRPPTVAGELVLKLLAVAIRNAGGFAALRPGFDRHRNPDSVPDALIELRDPGV